MQYENKDGTVRELLWNSRDGVTPFCIMSADGETELQHVRWQEDIREPFYNPEPGMRCFIDTTEEAAARYVEQSVEAWFATEEKRTFAAENGMTKEKLREIKEEEYAECVARGEPDVIVATPEWVAGLVRPNVRWRFA